MLFKLSLEKSIFYGFSAGNLAIILDGQSEIGAHSQQSLLFDLFETF